MLLACVMCYAVAVQAQGSGDKCHVYIVDTKVGSKLQEEFFSGESNLSDAEFERRMGAAQTLFDEFTTEVAEETSTTKTYTIPNTNKVITATVYYTDEMMASKRGADSMLMAIVIGGKKLASAINAEGSVMSELTANGFDTARVKTITRIAGRELLVGMECSNSSLKDDDK